MEILEDEDADFHRYLGSLWKLRFFDDEHGIPYARAEPRIPKEQSMNDGNPHLMICYPSLDMTPEPGEYCFLRSVDPGVNDIFWLSWCIGRAQNPRFFYFARIRLLDLISMLENSKRITSAQVVAYEEGTREIMPLDHLMHCASDEEINRVRVLLEERTPNFRFSP